MKIAVASSGLGHIRRGIETWAEDLALALRRTGQDVALFQGGGNASEPWRHVIACQRRFDFQTRAFVAFARWLGGWRYGFGSEYQAEQTTFAFSLWRKIRSDFDILHVQDPWLGLLLDRAQRAGISRPRVLLAHGTEETPEYLRRFSALQHLAPCYLEEWEPHRPPKQKVFAIPNFVDMEQFRPGDRLAARARWGLPPGDCVVLSVAAIKKHHKRIDYLIREFQQFASAARRPATLVVAGARERETDEVIALGKQMLGERVRFLEGVPRASMASLYQAADIFTLASLHEMMPIALLEALASGLPVACNRTPVLSWMAGPEAALRDISAAGALAAQFEDLEKTHAEGEASRAIEHVRKTFSEPAVIGQILAAYREVASADK